MILLPVVHFFCTTKNTSLIVITMGYCQIRPENSDLLIQITYQDLLNCVIL